MESVLLLLFMFLLALMFLGMVYGERLNFPGWAEGEVFGPVGALAEKLWGGICEGVDEGTEFLLVHLSWVVAAVSGTAGLLMVAILMGIGLSSDAEDWHRDIMTPLRSGGVLDKVERVTPRDDRAATVMANTEVDDSQFVSRVITGDYLVFGRPEYAAIRPRPRRPIEGGRIDLIDSETAYRQPRLSVSFRRLGSFVNRADSGPEVIVRGRLVDDLPKPLFVERALRDLLRDDWRESRGLPRSDDPRIGLPQDMVPESSRAAVRELESRVRVTPGALVSEQDLRVEKTAPEQSATGEITIQISLTNLGIETIDGLLVREFLPLDTLVRSAEPEGVLRSGTMTWLVDNLRPSEEYLMRFTVLPSSRPDTVLGTTFVSTTEISALAAVTTTTVVSDETSPLESLPGNRSRQVPPITRTNSESSEPVGAPDLQMSIAEPRSAASVGAWTRILFTLTNEGTADAESVSLRLTLGESLDHHALLDVPNVDRQVVVNVRRIRPGEAREFQLEVRPNAAGDILSTAELYYDNAQIGLETFRLVAREDENRPFPPDTSVQ